MPDLFDDKAPKTCEGRPAFKGTPTPEGGDPAGLPVASGSGGSKTLRCELGPSQSLEALKLVIRSRLAKHEAIMAGKVQPTEATFPKDLQAQISSEDLHVILDNLNSGLSSSLGEQLLTLNDGESLYFKRETSSIEIIDKTTGEKHDATFPRSIQIFKEQGEFKIAIETKTKLAKRGLNGILHKFRNTKTGTYKKIKPSWIIDKNGYIKEAAVLVFMEVASNAMFRRGLSGLSPKEREKLDKATKESLLGESSIPNALKDQALTMTRGPFSHMGKHGHTTEVRAQYYSYDLFDIAASKALQKKLHAEPGLREKIALELIRGIKVMHENGYIHSDIKIENILLDDQLRPAYTDFGYSCKISDRQVFQGSAFYLAPETMLAAQKGVKWGVDGSPFTDTRKPEPHPWKIPTIKTYINTGSQQTAEKYRYKSTEKDCWALGLVLLQLFTSKWLWGITVRDRGKDSILLEKVITTPGPYTGNAQVDEIITKVIKPLLCVDPETRISCIDAYTVLEGILQKRKITPFFSPEQSAEEGKGAAYTPAAKLALAAGPSHEVAAGDAAAREIVPSAISGLLR